MHAARADLSWAFCSYCGHPPMGRWRSLAHRVCRRCQMGTVLHAPPGLQPRFDEPFVIVDARLRLQAVSRRAEVLLIVDEPAAVDVALAEFLVCRTDRDHIALAGLVQHAVGGSRSANRVELRTVGDPAIEVLARVAGCGLPPAAVLILTPLRTSRTRRSERAQRRAAVADRLTGATGS
jgi:hypothetical protein